MSNLKLLTIKINNEVLFDTYVDNITFNLISNRVRAIIQHPNMLQTDNGDGTITLSPANPDSFKIKPVREIDGEGASITATDLPQNCRKCLRQLKVNDVGCFDTRCPIAKTRI